METSKSSEPFRELLAKDFLLTISEDKISTSLKLEEHLKKVSSQRIDCTHAYKNLIVKETKKNTFSVSLDLERTTINLQNEILKEEIHQESILENNMDERFVRMKKMIASEVKPLQTVAG